MRYGTPYRGSKNAIAPWVVEHLPAADVLVDLFAGGCAVTHAAMLSGRFGRFVANDLTEAPQVFVDAINGEFEGFSTVPTREEFLSSDDDALRLMYSFGNNREDYLWSRELEPVKVSASRMVLAPSVHERKRAYRDFMRALRSYVESSCRMPDVDRKHDGALEGLENLERLQGLERLQSLDGLLTVSRVDYRAVGVPGGGDGLRRPSLPRHELPRIPRRGAVRLRRVRHVALGRAVHGGRQRVRGPGGVRRGREN